MGAHEGVTRIISNDPRFLRSCAVARAIFHSGRPLLVLGESGTGKRLLSRTLHTDRNSSDRNGAGRYYSWNARDVEIEDLFTLDPAASVHLRELPSLSTAGQSALLNRLTETLSVTPDPIPGPRIVFDATPELAAEIESGRFDRELYILLSGGEIRLSPLRERDRDIPPLVEYFVQVFATEENRPRPRVDVSFLDRLAAYRFPGNVAELRMLVRKALHWSQGERLTGAVAEETLHNHVITPIADRLLDHHRSSLSQIRFPLQLPTAAEARKQLVLEALRRSGGNQSEAARTLGLTPPAINKFISNLTDR